MMEQEREPMLQNYRSEQRTKKDRAYFFVSAIVFSVFLLINVIALGAFSVIQKRVADFSSILEQGPKCILFSQFGGWKIKNETLWLKLSDISMCGFVLCGLVSLTLVALLWLIYSIVLAVLGWKVLSPLRILDFVVMAISFLVSLAPSIVITAGLKATCEAFYNVTRNCANTSSTLPGDKIEILFYYNPVYNSQITSWITTVMLLVFTVWNLVLIIQYRRFRSRAEPEENDLTDEQPADTDDLEMQRPSKSLFTITTQQT